MHEWHISHKIILHSYGHNNIRLIIKIDTEEPGAPSHIKPYLHHMQSYAIIISTKMMMKRFHRFESVYTPAPIIEIDTDHSQGQSPSRLHKLVTNSTTAPIIDVVVTSRE